MSTAIEHQALVDMAWEASQRAYAPYSGFLVGAALLTKAGKVYTGCNIENVAFGPSNCAERTAIFKAVSEGERDFAAIAVVGERADGTSDPDSYATPCGVCRQVMLEFCSPQDFIIVLGSRAGGRKTFTLAQLLPESFGAI